MRIFYRIVFYALSVVIMGVISTSPDLNKTEGIIVTCFLGLLFIIYEEASG